MEISSGALIDKTTLETASPRRIDNEDHSPPLLPNGQS
jgi:hypothetical protein